MIDARLFALVAALVLAPILLSRNVARIVGATLLAHADAIDAYRVRFSSRASHWFDQAVAAAAITALGQLSWIEIETVEEA